MGTGTVRTVKDESCQDNEETSEFVEAPGPAGLFVGPRTAMPPPSPLSCPNSMLRWRESRVSDTCVASLSPVVSDSSSAALCAAVDAVAASWVASA